MNMQKRFNNKLLKLFQFGCALDGSLCIEHLNTPNLQFRRCIDENDGHNGYFNV
jgi:hypothetical protein